MNEISAKQLSIMIFFIPLVYKMSTLPALLYDEVSSTAYVIIAIITAIEFIQLALVLFVCKQGGMEGIKDKYGVTVYRIIAVPMLFVFFIKSLLFLHELSIYVTNFLFYNVSEMSCAILVLLVCFYLGIKGARSVGRLFEISIWIIPIILILGIFFGEISVNSMYLSPIFENDANTYISAIGKYLIFMFDFSPLLFLKVNVKRASPIVACSVLSIIVMTGCYMLLFATYGNASHLAYSGFARLASFSTIVGEIGSLDWPSGILWLMTGILNIALKFNATDKIMHSLKLGKIGTAGFAITIAVIMFTVLPTYNKMLAFVTGGVQYVIIGLEILLPLILLALYAINIKRKEYATQN